MDKDEFDDVKKALEDLRAAAKPTVKDPVELAADQILDRAAGSLPVGPQSPNDPLLCGHSLSQLLSGYSKRMQTEIMGELKRRGLMSNTGIQAAAVTQERPVSRPFTLNERMAARMHWGTLGGGNWGTLGGGKNSWAPGFEHMTIHQAGDKVFVWVLTIDLEPVTLEDEAGLFPSDTMVTKLRLMEK